MRSLVLGLVACVVLLFGAVDFADASDCYGVRSYGYGYAPVYRAPVRVHCDIYGNCHRVYGPTFYGHSSFDYGRSRTYFHGHRDRFFSPYGSRTRTTTFFNGRRYY